MALPCISNITEERLPDILTSEPNSGFLVRRAKQSNFLPKRYLLQWNLLNESDKDDLLTEFNNTRGGAGWLNLSLPTSLGGATVKVRFVESSLQVNKIGALHWSAETTVELIRIQKDS